MGVWKKQKTFRITRDLMRLLQKEHLLIFQSTLPDPRSRAQVTAIARFQSTLPERGETVWSTRRLSVSPYFNPLSPHGERPAACSLTRRRKRDFNPLSPHGERLRVGFDVVFAQNFNPLSPHGERLCAAAGDARENVFQSTLPAWGETTNYQEEILRMVFQSTLPAWGETEGILEPISYPCISIHSPRMGRD